MSLWGRFGDGVFQNSHTIPIIPIIPTIHQAEPEKGISGDIGDIGEIVSNLKNAQQGEVPAPPIENEREPEKEPLPLEVMTTEEIIAAVREFFQGEVPVKYKSMPDWRRFCDAFPHCIRDDGEVCRFYQPNDACCCWLFEASFPNVGWWHMLKSKK